MLGLTSMLVCINLSMSAILFWFTLERSNEEGTRDANRQEEKQSPAKRLGVRQGTQTSLCHRHVWIGICIYAGNPSCCHHRLPETASILGIYMYDRSKQNINPGISNLSSTDKYFRLWIKRKHQFRVMGVAPPATHTHHHHHHHNHHGPHTLPPKGY